MRNYFLAGFMVTILLLPLIALSQNKDIPERITQFSFENLNIIADNTLKIEVKIIDTHVLEPYVWRMTPADIAVFYDKLKNIRNTKPIVSNLVITNPSKRYRGLEFTITNKYNENIEPFVLFDGKLLSFSGEELTKDHNRDLEYTVWGLNYSQKNQSMMWKFLPIIDFKTCIKLGNRLIETTPRQCLLTNGEIFLDVDEKPTQESLSIKTFDDCLMKGQAIINTFPRRCIAAGGHVYAEPPRIR